MVVFSWYCWRFRKTTSFYRTAVRVICLFSFLGVCQNCIWLLMYQIWSGTNKEEKAYQKNTFSFQVKASFLSRNIDENIQVIYRLYRLSVMLQRRTPRKSNHRHHHHHHFLLLCRWTTSKRQEVIARTPTPLHSPSHSHFDTAVGKAGDFGHRTKTISACSHQAVASTRPFLTRWLGDL